MEIGSVGMVVQWICVCGGERAGTGQGLEAIPVMGAARFKCFLLCITCQDSMKTEMHY